MEFDKDEIWQLLEVNEQKRDDLRRDWKIM